MKEEKTPSLWPWGMTAALAAAALFAACNYPPQPEYHPNPYPPLIVTATPTATPPLMFPTPAPTPPLMFPTPAATPFATKTPGFIMPPGGFQLMTPVQTPKATPSYQIKPTAQAMPGQFQINPNLIQQGQIQQIHP
ncbi:MAG: hypothetical protein NTW86_20455 [Candidatus Sumerlaeota bacterium]|nr:hypothetical protein [Candidatus Sumerlaeota bacterium]